MAYVIYVLVFLDINRYYCCIITAPIFGTFFV